MAMMSKRASDRQRLTSRVEQVLLRCLEWTQAGRHRKVLTEIDRLVPQVAGEPHLEAQLLVWKAQALLAMGLGDRALPAASRSWDLEASPHACHLLANTLTAVGEAEEAEELLRLGRRLFPDALHLSLQLAMQLSDQGRVPEAIGVLDELPEDADLGDDLQVFIFGLRANLLAVMGRWNEAEILLGEGLRRHPDSDVLRETHGSLSSAHRRMRAEAALVRSWEGSLEPLEGVPAEVDDAVVQIAAAMEAPHLRALAARRLWRAFLRVGPVRPQAVGAWGAALLLVVTELDGERAVPAAFAPAADAVPATIRGVAARLRRFLSEQDRELAHRAFAAVTNPRLAEEPQQDGAEEEGGDNVIAFPTRP